jgi:hypothetical protein
LIDAVITSMFIEPEVYLQCKKSRVRWDEWLSFVLPGDRPSCCHTS